MVYGNLRSARVSRVIGASDSVCGRASRNPVDVTRLGKTRDIMICKP